MNLGKQTFQRKRLALVLKLSSNASLTFRYIANNINNLPFLVAALSNNDKEQFLCPVVGENKPRLQDVMCDLSHTSYKNKIVRVEIVGTPPYFTIQEQKTDGVDVKFLKYLTERNNLQFNMSMPKTYTAALSAVCMRDYLCSTIFPFNSDDITKTFCFRP